MPENQSEFKGLFARNLFEHPRMPFECTYKKRSDRLYLSDPVPYKGHPAGVVCCEVLHLLVQVGFYPGTSPWLRPIALFP